MRKIELIEVDPRKELKIEASINGLNCKHLIYLLKIQPDFACMLKINGIEVGLCNTKKVINLLKSEIKEAKKCIQGVKNKFE